MESYLIMIAMCEAMLGGVLSLSKICISQEGLYLTSGIVPSYTSMTWLTVTEANISQKNNK